MPGSPPLQGGAYYQYYTNIAYCWAERVIEIRSGASYEDYVLNKVLRPLGIDKPRLAQSDNMARWYAGDSANAEINAYYDQPIASNPAATLYSNWCALYEGALTARLCRPAARTTIAPTTTAVRAAGCFPRRSICACCKAPSSGCVRPICWIFRRAMSAAPIRCSRARRCRAEPVVPTTSATATVMAPA